MKPLFIAIDGPDGSGKTTLVKRLVQHFKDQGEPCETFIAIGQGPLGAICREMTVHRQTNNEAFLALLPLVAHMECYHNYVVKALAQGKHVIVDRWVYSYLAYQYGGEENLMAMKLFNQFYRDNEAGMHWPDLTFICQVSLDNAMERIHSRQEKASPFDLKSPVWHQRVHDGFNSILPLFNFLKATDKTQHFQDKYCFALDCNKTSDEVFQQAVNHLPRN